MDPLKSERDLFEQVAESFLARFRSGERPSLSEYTARYPDLAGQIGELFPLLVEMEGHRPGQQAPVPTAQSVRAPGPAPQQLDDYLILREIGRGGMGVVYEAEQLSLGRRVALKLLPEHLPDSTKNRQRFEREARAAAKLHHTNIVPVFAIGEHDGRAYYVMQFIQGHGLDEVIDELLKLQSGQCPGEHRGPHLPSELSAADMARSLLTGGLPLTVAPAAVDQPARAEIDVGNAQTLPAPLERPPLAPGSATDARTNGGVGRSDNPSYAAATAPKAVTPTNTRLSDIFNRAAPDGSGLETAASSTSARRSNYWHCVAHIGLQVAEALAYAHKHGILHRDIKPSNLLLDTQETAWVTDFGLAKVEDKQNLTHTGDLLGTLRYMAPEALDGKCDRRSDVYGLGLTLYEMLAMRPAFGERERNRLIKQITSAEPVRLGRVNPAIPRDLATIVQKAIEREPDHRYATADELAADLRRFLDDAPIQARRIGSAERLYRWCRRNRAVAALAGTVLLLITTLAIVSTIGTIWLGSALNDANAKLWGSLASQARASRMTRQSGQRLDALRAIRKALELPVPPGRSRDELRTEAIAALLLPDFEVAKELPEGFPIGTSGLALDSTFERYARADKDGNVSIHRVADDTLLHTLPGVGESNPWRVVQFSPDGRFFYQHCTIQGTPPRPHGRLWRVDAPNAAEIPVPDRGSVYCCFEPEGDRCALAYPDHTIRFVDLATHKLTETTVRHRLAGEVLLAWCPRRPLLVVGATNSEICQLFDVASGAICGELRIPGNVAWLDWHPDGEILAVAGSDRKIHLLDSRSGRDVLPPLGAPLNDGIVCRFSHAGDWLISDDWSNVLRVWDTRTGQQLFTQGGASGFPQFSHDDRLLGPLVSGTKVRLMRSIQRKALRTIRASAGLGFYAMHGRACTDDNGSWLAAAFDRGVILIDLARGSEAAVLALPGNFPFRFDSHEQALWTHGNDGLLRWPLRTDVTRAREIRVGPPDRLSRGVGGEVWGASRDGNILAIPNYDGASLWHRSSNRVLRVGPQYDVRLCAVSPDGRWAATGSHWLNEGSGAKVWDAGSGGHVADLPVGDLCRVDFSPKGTWLVTSAGGCRLWEAGTWREKAKLANPAENAWHAFTADEKLLALGDQPGVVRLVGPETGQEFARMTIPEADRLHPVCFTPDGRQLAAIGGESLALYLFDLATLRKELRELGLDWDNSPLPPISEHPIEPIHVTVDLGDFRRSAEAGELVAKAMQSEQKKKHREALAALREAIKTDPTHVMANNNLAWLLVSGPKELRDAQAALPLARKAAELEPQSALYLNTLGVALYRNGKYTEAISVLEKSLAESRGRSDAFDLFFLAMCHRQLGEPAKAKDCYDQALKWVRDRRDLPASWIEDLTAFQAEADALFAHGEAP